jgi:hypothetical protein
MLPHCHLQISKWRKWITVQCILPLTSFKFNDLFIDSYVCRQVTEQFLLLLLCHHITVGVIALTVLCCYLNDVQCLVSLLFVCLSFSRALYLSLVIELARKRIKLLVLITTEVSDMCASMTGFYILHKHEERKSKSVFLEQTVVLPLTAYWIALQRSVT